MEPAAPFAALVAAQRICNRTLKYHRHGFLTGCDLGRCPDIVLEQPFPPEPGAFGGHFCHRCLLQNVPLLDRLGLPKQVRDHRLVCLFMRWWSCLISPDYQLATTYANTSLWVTPREPHNCVHLAEPSVLSD
jgi:hypothetical protein